MFFFLKSTYLLYKDVVISMRNSNLLKQLLRDVKSDPCTFSGSLPNYDIY